MTLSAAVLSSTYFHRSGHSSRRSFIITRKRTGASTVPCGTRPFIVLQLEEQLPSFTRWLRSVKKLLIQLRIVTGTFKYINLRSKMLWSIKSNALAKSSKKTLTAHFDASVSFERWCSRLIKLWVVEEFFKEPNCLLSILFLIELISQSHTNDSQILDKVGVNEIGRKSVVISAGIEVFGIEITSAFFHTVETCRAVARGLIGRGVYIHLFVLCPTKLFWN